MSARKQVLFLAHRIPYPPDKGDKIRSWRLFERLAQHFDVHLGCFVDDPNDFRHADFLRSKTASCEFIPLRPFWAKARCSFAFFTKAPLSVHYYEDARMRRFVARARANGLAAEVAFSSPMAAYIETSNGCPRIVDFCDSDSEKWNDYSSSSSGVLRAIYALEASRLASAETKIANWADASFAVSTEETSLFNRRDDVIRNVLTLRNGVDTNYFSPDGDFSRRAGAEITFVGAMDYRPNVDAVIWFVHEVWPIVRRRFSHARFSIIGANPAPQIAALRGQNGIDVTGRVDDVRPFIAAAHAVVAPLRIARGVQNKVLEAMAMSKAVVATSAANTGIGGRDGVEVLIADTPGDMAARIAEALENQERRLAIGEAARAKVLAEFTWDQHLRGLDTVLTGLGALDPP